MDHRALVHDLLRPTDLICQQRAPHFTIWLDGFHSVNASTSNDVQQQQQHAAEEIEINKKNTAPYNKSSPYTFGGSAWRKSY